MPGTRVGERASVDHRRFGRPNDVTETRRNHLPSIALLGLIAVTTVDSLVVPLPAWAQQQPVGEARIVVNNVTGTLPPGPEGVLRVGKDVFEGEDINAAANSSTLLVFQDSTQLAICPTARVTLRRVNPPRGELAILIARGCTRYTSGELLKVAHINTPSAVIDTYGTIVTITVSARGGTTVSVAEGTASVTGAGRTVNVASGQSTLVLLGQPPTPPVPTPPEPPIVTEMNRLLLAASVQGFGTRAAARSAPVEQPTDAGTRIFTPNVDPKIISEIAGCGGTSRGTHGACGSRGTH